MEPRESYEQFVKQQLRWARIVRRDLTDALRRAGVHGYSKLRIAAVRDLVAATPAAAAEIEALRRSRAVAPRFAVRQSIGVSYGELEDIEKAAGVSPSGDVTVGTGAVCYDTWDDVERVWEAAATYEPPMQWVHVRISIDGTASQATADEFVRRMSSCGVRAANIHDYEGRKGGLNRYFDMTIE